MHPLVDCFTLLPITEFCNKQNIKSLMVGPSGTDSIFACFPELAQGVIQIGPFQGRTSSVINALCPNFFGVVTRNDQFLLGL
jgi:hypothetical protein